MCVIRRSVSYHIVFRPYKTEQIWLATGERNKTNAKALERELLRACRTKDYAQLSEEGRVLFFKMFNQRQWIIPADMGGKLVEQQPIEPPPAALNIQGAFKCFLNYPEIARSKSFGRYKQCLKHLQDYFGKSMPMDELTVPKLKQYRLDRLDVGVAAGTVNWQIGSLSKVFQVLIELGKLNDNPCRNLKSLSQREGERDAYIGFNDYKQILENVADWLRPIIQCAYLTGMRRNEIVELKKSHVIFERRMIVIAAADTKEYSWKRVPISRELERILKESIEKTGTECCWVFAIDGRKTQPKSFKRQWNNGIKNMDMKPRFHDLRATWKVNARNSGIEEEIRKAIMGHGTRTREVKERYGRILDHELVQAIDKMRYDFGPTVILTAK